MNHYVAQAKQFWASRTGNQRIFLGVGAAATVAMIAFFANLMLTPDYKPLIGSLEPADAQTITTELTAKKIPYQLSPDGKSISVPADQVDAARMSVASSEPTHSGRLGFELFDKVSWGETEFDEKVNYQRALEGELERTIMTLGGVKSARVHLVMATDSVFLDRERGAKASVTLKLNRGGLSHDETMSIQRLVAGAVDGLKPADVSIIDADSNESLGATGDGAAGEEGVERELSQRLVNTLTPVLGGDHVRASVNVEYDQGSKEVNEDKYDPTVVVPLVSQKSKETNGGADGTSGVAGTTSNVPQTTPQANVPAPDGADANQSSTTDNTTYGVNKVTTHSIEPAGRIRRITAAVVVDDLVKRKLQPNGKWTVTRQPRSLQELKQIEMLASTAIGIDATRGDVINVENLSFDRPDDSDVPVPTILDKARKGVEDYSSLVRYGMLLALFALAYVLMIRPVQKRVLGTGIQTPPEALLADGGKPLSLAAPAPEVMRTLHLKERLIEQVKAEPATSARVVQAWLRGGDRMNMELELSAMSGVRKAAILITALGDEAAAAIICHLRDDELQGLTQEIARLGSVPKEISLAVLEEYEQMSEAHVHITQGGQEVATRLLIKAFGESGAKEMVQRLVRSQEANSTRIESLQRIDPKQMARFLEGEHPQTIALVLGHLDTKQASALLMCLPHPVRAESVRRLANLRQFSPAMTEKVATVLNRRLRLVGEQKKKTYSGFQSVADLMNSIDANTSGEILQTIEKDEAALAVSIRDLMFTFEDFLGVSEVQLRAITSAVDKKTLTLALKGARESIAQHFYQTMSSRTVEMMKEEADSLGPVRSKEVAKAQLEVVATARKLEAEGKIVLKSEGGDDYVV